MTGVGIQEIRAKSEEIQEVLAKMSMEFPWEDVNVYLGWLAQTYEYARFSTRILALTSGHFPLDKTVHSNRFIQHASEEKGHDRLLLNDARALGSDLRSVPVLPVAEAFHKSLYFWIYHGRPCVILGWVLCLEGFAIRNCGRVFDRVEKAFGKRAGSFLRVHAAEDPDHLEKAFAALESCSESDLQDVRHGLELYGALYKEIFDSIRQWFETSGGRKRQVA